MGRKIKRKTFISIEEAREFFNHLKEESHSFVVLLSSILVFGVFERWLFSFSNWVPLAVAVWATFQYGNYKRQILVEDLNKKWKRVMLNTSPITPLEHCEWLNKLLMEIWPNFMNPKLSIRFASMVEQRLKYRKSRLVEKIDILEFSLGSNPPSLGLQGTRWSTSGDQRVMHLGFDWDTSDMSILLLVKLAKPLMGTARIVVNSLHIKGDLLLTPILDGKAVLYSFVSTPEVRIGVAFGSGGSQSLPATELPGVSSWLVKILSETLSKRMVEPRRSCYSLPAEDLKKKAVGGMIHVTVISADKLSRSSLKGSPSRKLQTDGSVNDKDLQTFVEVELEDLTRRTHVKPGSNPQWLSSFNMVLHDVTGTLVFNLCEFNPGNVKYDIIASCEVKVKYVMDDSTIFWAIGTDNGVIAKQAEYCGREVEMVVPFEGVSSGELAVKLVMKEWQFADGSHSLSTLCSSSRNSLNGSSKFLLKSGRKIHVTVVEGKDLIAKDRSGKCDTYLKLQYGKAIQRTKTISARNCLWNQKFEFDEIAGGEYLRVKCFSEEILGDDSIGSARVNLEGLIEGSMKDIWVPLEKVNFGEIRFQIEAVRMDEDEGLKAGWIELVLFEARDLVAADLRGTSDPYVRVQYGNRRRRTKVVYKTVNPKWKQTFEFPDDDSLLELNVRDHNALLPTSSIGDCIVDYKRLPPNETIDKWIPLQGVKKGEIHIQITRKVPELIKRLSLDADPSAKAHKVSTKKKEMMAKFLTLVEDGNIEELPSALHELENLEDEQEEYLVQLEMEQALLLNKIKELGQEMLNSSPFIPETYPRL